MRVALKASGWNIRAPTFTAEKFAPQMTAMSTSDRSVGVSPARAGAAVCAGVSAGVTLVVMVTR